ncbi:MAG: hypothetical protein DRQ13_08990 [Ignavibacteriae bacterium]|nr:MAG: hypothetical protein DRQ13_08990 [Ignavibacteriota bacterium]
MRNNGIRKQRDTSYSMTQKLLKKIGEGRVVEYWKRHGMYKSAELLSIEMQEYVSPYTMRHISNIKNLKRPVNKLSPIYKGVMAGTVPASYYRHLIFPEEENENV